uniref:Uncharacterized protein n=1 Tax=Lepeophtheirus salmonis TaxID=72036 RepID=A0A0K2T071_LEPSM
MENHIHLERVHEVEGVLKKGLEKELMHHNHLGRVWEWGKVREQENHIHLVLVKEKGMVQEQVQELEHHTHLALSKEQGRIQEQVQELGMNLEQEHHN